MKRQVGTNVMRFAAALAAAGGFLIAGPGGPGHAATVGCPGHSRLCPHDGGRADQAPATTATTTATSTTPAPSPQVTTTTTTPTTPAASTPSATTTPTTPEVQSAPSLSVTATDQTDVTVAWTAPGGGQNGAYLVLLDGRTVGSTSGLSFVFGRLGCGTHHQVGIVWSATRAQASISISTASCTPSPRPTPPVLQELRSLDGSENDPRHPDWGEAGTQYARIAPANYADHVGAMVGGPSPRRISNRIFNDLGQNIFSENDISQWGWAWGQFVDHDLDLRDETPAESAPIPFDQSDPLERFTNQVGQMDFSRTPAAPGTGVTSPRQQINTISSFIDASQVYGSTQARLDWLTAANGYDLMLSDGYLPKVTARGDATTAPTMDLMGQLAGNPTDAVVAGDVRANENLALTAIETLFAREHNRIADSLPAPLTPAQKFQIARRVVGAEIQWITYTQFLPTLGVRLDPYRGYDPNVNPSVTNEFATVGFRAHSMVHGEFEPTVPAGTYTAAQLQAFHSAGVVIENNADGTVTLVIPLALAFGNPDLVQQIGLGPALQSLGEREYRNDEQIDDSMRSTLFEVPKPGITDPSVCGEPVVNPSCYSDVEDLGADDVQRGRDHGMPAYNQLRQAYGLPAVHSFTEITGEATDALPRGMSCDDPRIMTFVSLKDEHGNPVPLGDPDNATSGVRASTLAARLKCLYGTVDNIDAFVGMVSERHLYGTEFGPLQLAIWKKQFAATRDGDRFFYANDPALEQIEHAYGIDYRQTLSRIVNLNTGETLPDNVFKAGD